MSDEHMPPVPVPAVDHLISAYNLDLAELNNSIKEVNDIAQLPASHGSSRYEQSLKRAVEAHVRQIRTLIKENAAWTIIQNQTSAALQESNQRRCRALNFVVSLGISYEEREEAYRIYREALPASKDGDGGALDEFVSSYEARLKESKDVITGLEEQIRDLKDEKTTVEEDQSALRLEVTQYLHPLLLSVFGNATENVSALANSHLKGPGWTKSLGDKIVREQYTELLRLMRTTQRGREPDQPPSLQFIDLGTGLLPTTLAQFGFPHSFVMRLKESSLPLDINEFKKMHTEVMREVGMMTLPELAAELRQDKGDPT
ncbi:hypothetical protein BKA63DRAFT_497486 [Paraphoma chrysanthemicola]|nr:hypothetical protein BKA63DRAFT_497486 [Paraphoma chrysanthemicola]